VECVAAGLPVTVVDQAPIPHPQAASNDRHRVVRALHPRDAALTRAGSRALRAWRALERRLRLRLLVAVGALHVLPPDEVPWHLELLGAGGMPAEALTPEQLADRYPMLRLPPGHAAILEAAAGVVLADLLLSRLGQWLGEQPGVRFRLGTPVTAIDPAGLVHLADGTSLGARRVVVATGPFTRDLLAPALARRLTLYRQSTLYCRPWGSLHAWSATPAMPTLGSAQGAWLVPPVNGTPLRLSAHGACREVGTMSSDETPPFWKERLCELFASLLAGFHPGVVAGARDGYYLADALHGGPLLLTLGAGTVWCYAACGGSSFKFAPLIAAALARRAAGSEPEPTGIDAVDDPEAGDDLVLAGHPIGRGSHETAGTGSRPA